MLEAAGAGLPTDRIAIHEIPYLLDEELVAACSTYLADLTGLPTDFFGAAADATPALLPNAQRATIYRTSSGETMSDQMRARLRALPVLHGSAPGLDTDALPPSPSILFQHWLEHAVQAGVAEPHTMTLSTADHDGMPDARVLTLKDFDERGWAFASTKSSVKGYQLGARPYAALTFWWQPLVRSIRIRGEVREASRQESLADLRARSTAAQRDTDPDDWTVWRLVPSRVEFWQGSQDRRHIRIVYIAEGTDWRVEAPSSRGN